MLLLLIMMPANSEEIKLINPGFEQPGTGTFVRSWDLIAGWSTEKNGGSGIRKSEIYSPVEGEWIAYLDGDSQPIFQTTDHSITAGKSYTLRLWARSINRAGLSAETAVEAGFLSDEIPVSSTNVVVSIPSLKGAAATTPNDDGANVWIDGDYRHQFADKHMIQSLAADPIEDEWMIVENSAYEAIEGLGWAVGPVIAGDQRLIYGTIYRDNPADFYSSIPMIKVLSIEGQDYTWSDPVTLISHSGSEFPWVEDPHCFYDEETGRLWMSWGGGICYVSELDPQTGLFKDPQNDPEYDTHPRDMHVPVATWPETREGWDGDVYSNAWMEGAALYKHNEYWYFFGSYGHLGKNYTIRFGRGNNPTGPFYDKDDIDLMTFDEERNEFGNTILLGDEGDQLVPGHPHIWEEGGQFYMGYDFRKTADEEMDYIGIRRLYWIDDWPTTYTPVTLTFDSDDYPELIGNKLGVTIRNSGHEDSKLAVDHVTITVTEKTSTRGKKSNHTPDKFSLYQNYPNPFNPTTCIPFEVAESGRITLDVLNAVGKHMTTLVDQQMGAGKHRVFLMHRHTRAVCIITGFRVGMVPV